MLRKFVLMIVLLFRKGIKFFVYVFSIVRSSLQPSHPIGLHPFV